MTLEVKQRLEKIHLLLKDNGLVNHLSLHDAEWLLELIKKLGTEIDQLKEKQSNYDKLLPIVSAARGLMVDLGRGNRDVSFALAEIHNGLRVLDGKDYLASKAGIVIA